MRPQHVDIQMLRSEAAKAGEYPWGSPSQPGIIDFDAGFPDPTTFPIEELVALSERVIRRDSRLALQYGSASEVPYGYEGLRDLLGERALAEDGRKVEREGVVLTSGASQGISLGLSAFLNPGDVAVVEAPTWWYVLRDIRLVGARAVAVSVDEEGMNIDRLEESLSQLDSEGAPAKLIYTVANFNTPTGVTLSLERRRRLIDVARRRRIVVLEDDTYGDLRYEGEVLPSLFSLDDSGLVLKLKTFSKVLAPSLRLGWVLGHPDAVASLVAVRRDLGVSQLIARTVAEYVADGMLEPHISRINALYRTKRDAMAAALTEHCAPFVRWNTPQGGFFLWLELSERIHEETLKELTANAGIKCRLGERFYEDDSSGRSNLRAAFSLASVTEIERGIALLGKALEQSAH